MDRLGLVTPNDPCPSDGHRHDKVRTLPFYEMICYLFISMYVSYSVIGINIYLYNLALLGILITNHLDLYGDIGMGNLIYYLGNVRQDAKFISLEIAPD